MVLFLLANLKIPQSFRKSLLDTKGLGSWSAEYISLRAIGDTDAFPKTDLILKRALQLHPDLDLGVNQTLAILRGNLYVEGIRSQSVQTTIRVNPMTLFYKEIESPVGKLKLVASSNALVAVLWEREQPNRIKLDTATLDPQQPILLETERQLIEYFSGNRIDFDLPLQPAGQRVSKESLAGL